MSSRKPNNLSIDTTIRPLRISDDNDESLETPALPLSSTDSSSTTQPTPKTPTNQPTMTREDRETKAKLFVEGLDLVWNDLEEEAQRRAKRLMTKDYGCSPTKDDANDGRYKTTFEEEFNAFCDSLETDGEEWKSCDRLLTSTTCH